MALILAKDAKDITGLRVGRWLVMEAVERREQPNGKRQVYWRCRCDCGNEKIVMGGHLRRGATQSCGCLSADRTRELSTTHGRSKTADYAIWCAMIRRCECKSDPAYKFYGARGIKVCGRWRASYEAFIEDMGARPTRKHSIDRIDNAKGYEPGNCRWVLSKEQNRNRRSNVFLTFNGATRCIAEWEELLGVPPNAIGRRIRDYGWPVERALTQPLKVKNAGATQ